MCKRAIAPSMFIFWRSVIKCSRPWNLEPLPLHFNDIGLLGMRGSLIFSAFIVYEWFLCHSSLFRTTENFVIRRPVSWKIRKTALLAVPAAAIQQIQLLAALQAENHGIKHYCRQHHCMPPTLCLYPQDILFPRHSPVNFFWNSFPENGRRTIATTSWREAA